LVAERIAAYAEAGVTTLLAGPQAKNPDEAARFVAELRELAPA